MFILSCAGRPRRELIKCCVVTLLVGQVSCNLVYPERLQVTLDGLRVVSIGPMHQSEYVPAYVATQVVAQATTCKLVSLFFFVHAAQNETLHGQRFTVFAKLRCAQDLICILETLLVLLVFVEFLRAPDAGMLQAHVTGSDRPTRRAAVALSHHNILEQGGLLG